MGRSLGGGEPTLNATPDFSELRGRDLFSFERFFAIQDEEKRKWKLGKGLDVLWSQMWIIDRPKYAFSDFHLHTHCFSIAWRITPILSSCLKKDHFFLDVFHFNNGFSCIFTWHCFLTSKHGGIRCLIREVRGGIT